MKIFVDKDDVLKKEFYVIDSGNKINDTIEYVDEKSQETKTRPIKDSEGIKISIVVKRPNYAEKSFILQSAMDIKNGSTVINPNTYSISLLSVMLKSMQIGDNGEVVEFKKDDIANMRSDLADIVANQIIDMDLM